jgi:hypothetical protein
VAVREFDTIQFDTTDDLPRRERPSRERESAVERLASLVYSLLMAYIWLWILLGGFMVVGYLASRVF